MRNADGSFVRGQAIAISQLGYAVNLILGLATASLGFALTLAKDRDYIPGCGGTCLWLLSVLLLLASIAVGVWCVLNRLRDFRKTKDIAKDRERMERECAGETEIDRRLERRREETKQLGERTWTLFHWQIGTFGAGVVLQMAAFAVMYHAKLFPV